MSKSYFLVGLYTGGLMEDPELKVSGKEIITAESSQAAEELYNNKHACSFFYGGTIACMDLAGNVEVCDDKFFTEADRKRLVACSKVR